MTLSQDNQCLNSRNVDDFEYEETIEEASDQECEALQFEEKIEEADSDDVPSDHLYDDTDTALIDSFWSELELKDVSGKKKGRHKTKRPSNRNSISQKAPEIVETPVQLHDDIVYEEVIEPATSSEFEDNANECYECSLFGAYCTAHGTPEIQNNDRNVQPPKQVRPPEPPNPTFYSTTDTEHVDTYRTFSFKKQVMVETRITYRMKNGEVVPHKKKKELPLPEEIKQKFLNGELTDGPRKRRIPRKDRVPKPKNPKTVLDAEILQSLTDGDIEKIREDAKSRGRGRPKKGTVIPIRPCMLKKMQMPGYKEKRGRPPSRAFNSFLPSNQRRLIRIAATETDPNTLKLLSLIIQDFTYHVSAALLGSH